MSDEWGTNGEYMSEYLSPEHFRMAKRLAELGNEQDVRYWMQITNGTGKSPEEEWQERQRLAPAIEKITADADWNRYLPWSDTHHALAALRVNFHMEHQLRRFLPADEKTQGLWDFLNPPNELPKRELMGWSDVTL